MLPHCETDWGQRGAPGPQLREQLDKEVAASLLRGQGEQPTGKGFSPQAPFPEAWALMGIPQQLQEAPLKQELWFGEEGGTGKAEHVSP